MADVFDDDADEVEFPRHFDVMCTISSRLLLVGPSARLGFIVSVLAFDCPVPVCLGLTPHGVSMCSKAAP